jgi:hypothetical protein
VKRVKEVLIEQQLLRSHLGINKFLADVMLAQSREPEHEGMALIAVKFLRVALASVTPCGVFNANASIFGNQ